MKGTLGLKKGSVPFKNDLETRLVLLYLLLITGVIDFCESVSHHVQPYKVLDKNSCLFFFFADLDDWEVNHWLPSNRTSVPQLIETLVSFSW